MTVETRSGGEALRKQEPGTSVLQVTDEKTTKLQQFWNSKSEGIANKIDKHGAGDTSWIESVQDCPVYYPTKQDFTEDPLTYIQKIAGEASKYGICKIVSPVVASVPAGVVLSKEKSGFKFSTRLQPMRISNWDKDDKVAFPIKGRHYTLTEYEKVATRFFVRKFSSSAGLPPRFIESVFWKELVGGKTRSVEYATDVDGSAFSSAKTDPLGQSKWNLTGISKLPDSVLRLLEEAIPGVTEPMLYIGMLFSMFAWHIEDHYLYSINYQHCGAPKTWYGVPGDAALDFENIVKEHVYSRELLDHTGRGAELDLLLAKTTMFAPKVLMDHGVSVFKGVQYPGEFIVTFPRAYHAGFSHGFNCGEAVNFAVADWFPFGAEACLRYESLNRSPILPHDELLCKEAAAISYRDRIRRKGFPCKRHAFVINAFVALMQSQQQRKSNLEQRKGKKITSSVVNVSCGLCKHKCYVSYTHCKCFLEPTCLNHADFFSSCSCGGDRTIVLREDFDELVLTARKYENKVDRRKKPWKSPSSGFIIKEGDISPSTSVSKKRPLLTSATPLRKAGDGQQDRWEECTGLISINLEGSGICALPSCRPAVEEDESDREALKVKRRRVASSQSKQFLAEKHAVCKSLVRSLDFGSYSPVRRPDGSDIREQSITRVQEVPQRTPMTSGDLVSVHHVMEELNINGSTAKVMSLWQREAGTNWAILKIKEMTRGQGKLEVVSLKHLVSREEAMVLQQLLLKAGHNGFEHGHGNGKHVALIKLAIDNEICHNHEKVGSFHETRGSLFTMPIVRRMLLTVVIQQFGSPGVMPFGKSNCICIGDLTSKANSIVLRCESAPDAVQGLRPGSFFLKEVAASVVEAELDSCHPDNRSKEVPGDFTSIRVEIEHSREGEDTQGDAISIRVENEHPREGEDTPFESPCMEIESSAPLTELKADYPIPGMHAQEKDCVILQRSGSQVAELDMCQSATHQIKSAEIGSRMRQVRPLGMQDSAEMGNEEPLVADLAGEGSLCDPGLLSNEYSQRTSSSRETGVESVIPLIKKTGMGYESRQDTVLPLKVFVGNASGVRQEADVVGKDKICDMKDDFNENLEKVLLIPEPGLCTFRSGYGEDTGLGLETFAEMGNVMRECSAEEDGVCDISEGFNETMRRFSASSEARLDTCRLVTCQIENAGLAVKQSTKMQNELQQCRILSDEGRISDVKNVSDERLKSTNTLGNAISKHEVSIEAQPDVELANITKADFERASIANSEEVINDHLKPKVMNSLPPLPKQGLVIYLNRKMERSQEKPAKFTYDHNKSESNYDQVDIFEGQTDGDTWSLEEGLTSLCTVQNEGGLTELEQLRSIHTNRVQPHYSESYGVQESLTSDRLPSIFRDAFLDHIPDSDRDQEMFTERVEMRVDRSTGGELNDAMHQKKTSFCSQIGGDFLIWEPSNDDVIKPDVSFIQANDPMNSQLAEGEHKTGAVRSLSALSHREEGLPSHSCSSLSHREEYLPAHISKQQRTEPSFETLGKLQAGVRNFSEIPAGGLDAESLRVRSSPWRESSGYRAQSNESFKFNAYASQYNCHSWKRHHIVSSYHDKAQMPLIIDNGKYKRTMRSSVHQNHHHPYNRDTLRFTGYPRVSHTHKHVPRAHWQCRGNRKKSCGWKYGRSGNAFGGDRPRFSMDTDKSVSGCSASTSEATGYVEGYDPVKWEISSFANRQHFSYFDLDAPSAGRGFPEDL